MKKLLSLVAMLAFVVSATFAQTPAKEKKAKVATAQTAAKTKKDGTPDMRYKDNKQKTTAKPAGPTKKDGSADMRYKANKPKKN